MKEYFLFLEFFASRLNGQQQSVCVLISCSFRVPFHSLEFTSESKGREDISGMFSRKSDVW
jgi:hypothetical protein